MSRLMAVLATDLGGARRGRWDRPLVATLSLLVSGAFSAVATALMASRNVLLVPAVLTWLGHVPHPPKEALIADNLQGASQNRPREPSLGGRQVSASSAAGVVAVARGTGLSGRG
jgi:hypothetical protein